MKRYDISQEVLGCEVYPGDPEPTYRQLARISGGDDYNLSVFSMCSHNGTHVDAPRHFFEKGRTIGEMGLEHFVGPAFVAEHQGAIAARDAKEILKKAREAGADACRRILVKGKAVLTPEGARILAEEGLLLFGNEDQSVGTEENFMEVHRILLGADMALLEGIRLKNVPEGVYLLNAAPLNLGRAEGAPCRAVLMHLDEIGAGGCSRRREPK